MGDFIDRGRFMTGNGRRVLLVALLVVEIAAAIACRASGGAGVSREYEVLPAKADYIAPDGSEIRELVRLGRASMAHFRLAAGRTSRAVAHHTVEEFWYVTHGRGQMWLKPKTGEDRVVELEPGVSIAISPGTHFQFRAADEESLDVVGVTAPPWPGAQEAYQVEGRWDPDLEE